MEEDWTVQQMQAAYAIAVCNELLMCWDDECPDDRREVERVRDDIAATNGLVNTLELVALAKRFGRYQMCGGGK